jgi:hypothetical protein
MVHPKTVTLWQTYKKPTTTLVCATASMESGSRYGSQPRGASARDRMEAGETNRSFCLV